MLLSKILRTLRSRIIVGTILILCVIYSIVNIVKQFHTESNNIEDTEDLTVHHPRKPFQWHSPSDNSNVTELHQLPCRNSVQGSVFLADDRGYICQRKNILASGCCNVESPSTKRYACDTCYENHCCAIYEYCISCCMHPDKDHYELCLVKCRTSSQSVQHENSYRDPRHKHCYGEYKPAVQDVAVFSDLYRTPWLNNCAKTMCKPRSHLDKVIEKIIEDLVPRLASELRNSKDECRQHAMCHLLGFPFVNAHYPFMNYDPEYMETIPTSKWNATVEECKAVISEHLEHLVEVHGFDRPLSKYSQALPLGSFLADSRRVLDEGMDRCLRDAKKTKIKPNAKGRSTKPPAMGSMNMDVWENKTDAMGQALMDVCEHEPRRVEAMLKTFGEVHYPLPIPFKKFLLKNFVFLKERRNYPAELTLAQIEESWMTRFSKTVKPQASNTATGNPQGMQSPFWRQIDKAVGEMYSRIATLREHNTDYREKEAAAVLNTVHMYNKTFHPVLVLWLSPLQVIFGYSVRTSESHVMELAAFLELVSRHCMPAADRTFAIAQQVVNTWKHWDADVFASVQGALKRNTRINVKDFPAGVLHVHRSEANKIQVKLEGKFRNDVPDAYLAIFNDPAIFVRKWITEGFVGTVGYHALFFIWDQLLMGNWSEQGFVDVCITLIFLLRARFVKANNYFAVREVFVSDAGRLYTADIRRAYTRVSRGQELDTIHAVNRNAVFQN